MIEHLDNLAIENPIHFIGIGGCGMSGIAHSLRAMGFSISGSDMNESAAVQGLRQSGVNVSIGQNSGNIPSGTQLVVASAAIKPENPEYLAAQLRQIPIIKYARMLGILMRSRKGIAVAGTHGKTTTTAMVALALKELGADPSFVIGGEVPQLGGGSGIGSSDYLVAEACEFDRSFLNLYPQYAIINNIEEDHLDYYKDLDEIVGAFRDFALRLPQDGLLVHSVSSPNIARFLGDLSCHIISCGLDNPADYEASDIRYEGGKTIYSLRCKTAYRHSDGKDSVSNDKNAATECTVTLSTFGRHNVINSLSAIALLHQLGFSLEAAAGAVGICRGASRRFETVYDGNGVCIVDDYAHHPTEIQTVLKSSRVYFEGRRLVAVFQPHQHSRTRFLMKDFARSFQYADLVIVPDIYFVRDSEQEREMVHARDLVRAVLANGGNAVYIPSFAEIQQFLWNNLNKGDVLLTMGAGNVWQIGANLAKMLQEK